MNPPIPKPSKPAPKSSSLSSHFAMIELKQRILSSVAKLSDRDTHRIAVEDLENIVHSISPDGASMLLNCLYDASADPKPAVKKEALRLISLLCTAHPDATSTHLTKIIANIVRRLKDSDSGVRDSCRDAIGALAGQCLRGEGDGGGLGPVVSLFVKPLFETMGEEKKGVQAGAAMCMARMVECAVDAPASVFQKLCPRICKYLNSQNVLAKAALLSVVASLSQAGAIAPQNMPTLLQSIHDCLESSDWTTRKAAADTLSVLASHSSHLIAEKASLTITALERCRFDKVKPVRDSMTEALQIWKKIAEKGSDTNPDSPNVGSSDEKVSDTGDSVGKTNSKRANPNDGKLEAAKDTLTISATTDSLSDTKGSNATDRTVAILKKAPTLSNKEVNPEFFQKLETRSQGDLPVEIVVPSRPVHSSKSENEEKLDKNDAAYRGRSSYDGSVGLGDGHVSSSARYEITESGHAGVLSKQHDVEDSAHDRWTESRAFRRKELIARDSDINDRVEVSQRDQYNSRIGEFRNGHIEGSFIENKGNWMTIQKQLSQLERQQTHLMNMLQDFMGGSHDSMVTLENRVRGLERIIEDMQRDLALSSGRRAGNFMKGFEGSSGRPMGKYNGLSGREGEGRGSFAERFLPSDGMVSGVRGRDQPWRSEASDLWDSYSYGTPRNGSMGSRRALGGIQSDGRPSRLESEGDQIGTRRAWDKGPGRIRLGEGPSARSVWHASKDEATLEAIRVAGDDKTSRPGTNMHIPELNAEALGNSSVSRQDQGQVVWSNVMDTLHMGNLEMAYAEVLSTGDDVLLVKLMDKSGPVMDQLPDEIVTEVLHAVRQFLLEQSLFDICLSWIQQLVEIIMDNGPDVFGISMENKRELLLTLREASSVIDLPPDWEGETPDQLMLQLASAWGIELQ